MEAPPPEISYAAWGRAFFREAVATTDALGKYDLGAFAPGTYRVREVLYGGQVLTGAAAAGFLDVTLAAGAAQAVGNVGNRLTSAVLPLRTTPNLFATKYASVGQAVQMSTVRTTWWAVVPVRSRSSITGGPPGAGERTAPRAAG